MKKIILMMFLFVLSMTFFTCSLVCAMTTDEYTDKAYALIEEQRFDDALELLKEAYEQDPGNIGLVFAFAEVYHNKKEYYGAIMNYLNIISAIEGQGEEAPGQIHHNLVDAYNEIAQLHYFTEDICLRIIYHAEKVFELTPEVAGDPRYIEFLRKTIGHYEIAKTGARMLEEGGDGEEFDLPVDVVSEEKRLLYIEKANKRLSDFDLQQREDEYKTAVSNLAVSDIVEVLKKKEQEIKTIHFKVIIDKGSNESAIDEIYYKSPDKFKAVQKDADSIIIDDKYYVIDRATNKIVDEKSFDLQQADMLKALYLPNLEWVSNYYDLEVEAFKQVPDFLSKFYGSAISPDLYLITAKLKENTDSPYYPSVIKLEYYIDIKFGVAIAIREFWPGILGSGQTHEVSREHLVKSVEEFPKGSGIFLPDQVEIKGKAKELSGVNEFLLIVLLSLNEDIDDEEFSVESYRTNE